ncbi:uncharacterized protein F4807DRAFT_469664 [Annulohypoxylon truncatum]|uniref:uncharacterized protein n=1 Tax=Annulohypoxylon truncatum TaxID=327061 RepID=UPI0020074A34|nr:uncharacterized protein F4807DRAFT_469664 [Annulohypoxylon truncatum]KAI1213911.1 hypothetical protein F4807DRAFT_469664 [Annulohypoxylon truncatum]
MPPSVLPIKSSHRVLSRITRMATASPTPALPPPPGVTSNFVNPESLTDENNIAMGVSIPLITISFFLRVYARIWIRKTWVFEDWLALTAWASTVSLAGVGAATMANYGGRHEWDITREQAIQAAYWFNATTVNYGIAICITKLSVLWYYRRIFSPSRGRPFDISIVCLIVLLILFYSSTTLVKIWGCIPRAKIWDNDIPGSCINTPVLLDTSGVFNTLTDVIMLLLPVKAVWNMKLKLRQKVLVICVFTFGLCAPIFSVLGLVIRLEGNNNNDKSWIQPKIIMWGLAETTTGMLCVSFPELGPIIRRTKRATPSESILNGQYLSDDRSHPRQGSHGFSTVISQGMMKLESDPYIELDERDIYLAQHAAKTDHIRAWQQPGEITVTQEVTVDSYKRDSEDQPTY